MKKRILFAFISLLMVWFLGFLLFIKTIQEVPQDQYTKTDAIVVWTGWNCRVSTAIDLLVQGYSDKLFISGIKGGYPHLIFDRCQKETMNGKGLQEEMVRLRSKITLGPLALSTIGNAIETAKWVEGANIKSVRLVTTAIHLPRSLMEFQRYMPEIQVVAHPVSLEHFDHRDWYHSLSVFIVCAREYSKYLLFLLGIRPEWRDNIDE